jgi:hypothetical protein
MHYSSFYNYSTLRTSLNNPSVYSTYKKVTLHPLRVSWSEFAWTPLKAPLYSLVVTVVTWICVCAKMIKIYDGTILFWMHIFNSIVDLINVDISTFLDLTPLGRLSCHEKRTCRLFVDKLEHVDYSAIWCFIYIRSVKEIKYVKCKIIDFLVLI